MIDGNAFWTASGAIIAVSFAIATFSYKLLEEPIITKCAPCRRALCMCLSGQLN